MNEATQKTLPDFDRLAAVFDRYLPLVQLVSLAVLDHLPALPADAHVLDVACGTGEPGLTLARCSPDVRLLGVDAAAGMVEVARMKAARENLSNARFEVMGAETLDCADASMDAVISRFGLLMFGDVAAMVHEVGRALRPGASFSLAVWDDMSRNTLVGALLAALRPRVSAGLFAGFDRLNALAVEGQRDKLLREVGMSEVRSEWFEWNYDFADDAAWWDFVANPGMFTQQFAGLDETAKDQVRREVTAALACYRREDGSYQIPHACRLFWGRR